MSSGIINGKLNTNNIYSVKMFFIFIAMLIISPSALAVKNEKGWVIVIDAGHGGRDPGALGSASREKDITLAIALKTGEYIEQNIKNVTVIYTRKSDITVDLMDRPKIANKANADLFISIHANYAKQKNVKGTETFIMGLTKDEQNLEVAMKENEVILMENDYSTKYEGFDPKSPESYVMFSLMQNIFQRQSTDLASKIQTEYTEKVNRSDRGVKQAGFWVLFMTTMPSVLTETGFITNPAEEKYLSSKEGQDFLASGIYRACRAYISEIDSKSITLTGKTPDNETVETKAAPVSLPSGEIVFMIQIATSATKNEIKPENFNGLTDVSEIISQDRFKYASGSFSDYSAAVKYRKKLETIYPDAFVIAVKENKILPLQQALDEKKKNKTKNK
jgi:N-acetylmuramoyl-L-alanine amidase